MNFYRHLAVRWLLIVAAACCSLSTYAQTYPDRPVHLVIPYPPGGLADSFSRALADLLGKQLGQTVVVDNKPGGSLIIGTDAVAKAPADGYTLLLGSASSLSLNAAAFKKLPYDPIKDFSPVSLTFYTPLYLIVKSALPVHSVKELIAYAKAHPGELSYASLGYGSSLHLAAESFAHDAGIELLHIPYKGPSAAMADLLSGRVSMIFDGGAFLPQVQAGKVRLLAVTSAERVASLPDTPTIAQSGLPGYDMEFWFGIVAPAGTPKPIVDKLSRDIATVLKLPAFRDRMRLFPDVRYVSSTPEAMATLLDEDVRRWAKLLKDAGVKPQ